MVADPAIMLYYTNGNGSNQNFSNADLSLALDPRPTCRLPRRVLAPGLEWDVYYTGGPCGSSPTPTPTATASCTPSSFNVLVGVFRSMVRQLSFSRRY